jgi:hypothetical protein
MARVLVHATAAVELILSEGIAGVVSTGPEDTAHGFEAGQTHRLALIPANAVEAWPASLRRRPRWRGSATVGWSGQVILTMDGMPSGVIIPTVIAWPMP